MIYHKYYFSSFPAAKERSNVQLNILLMTYELAIEWLKPILR